MEETVLDGSKLKDIATESHTAKVVMNALASRERLRSSSDITRTKTTLMKAGNRIDDGEYMKLWKNLASAGVGSIVYGRKGKPDRFNWFYDLKAVAKAAMEGKDQEATQLETAEDIRPPKREGHTSVTSGPKKRGRPKKGHTTSKLNPIIQRVLFLPDDLSVEEVNEIIQTIKARAG